MGVREWRVRVCCGVVRWMDEWCFVRFVAHGRVGWHITMMHTQMEDVGGQSKVNIFSTQYDKQVRAFFKYEYVWQSTIK